MAYNTVRICILLAAATGIGCAEHDEGEPLPLEGVSQVELSYGTCGGAPAECRGAKVYRVQLVARALETHRCVEGAGLSSDVYGPKRGDEVTRRVLSEEEVARVREALGRVRHATAQITELDGAMTVLTLDGSRGPHEFSPNARCGPNTYDRITDGFGALEQAITGL